MDDSPGLKFQTSIINMDKENALAEAKKIFFMPGESLINDEYDEKSRDWLTALGVSVWKLVGGACNMMKKTGLAHSAWRIGSKMA